MIELNDVKVLSSKIVDQFQPEKIVLFGSYAYGIPTEDSDIDLLVIMPFEGLPVYQALEIRKHLGHSFALDLLVRRPDEIERRYREFDPIIRDALDEGIVLYERNSQRVA